VKELSSKTGRSLIPLRISLAALIILHALPPVVSGFNAWGLDQWKYFPARCIWISLSAGLLLLTPPVSGLLSKPLGRFGRIVSQERSKRSKYILNVISLALLAYLFWQARNATHFLGDGYLWANNLAKNSSQSYSAAAWLYRTIYRGLNAAGTFGEVNPIMSSALTSVMAGLILIAFAYRTAKLLSEKRGDFSFYIASILSCGTIMLFFGYIERYPPLAAGIMAFLYFSLKLIRHGGSIIPAATAFVVATALHPSALALLPGLVLLPFMRAEKNNINRKKLAMILLIIAAVGLTALRLLAGTDLFRGFFGEHFLPLFVSSSTQNVAYPIFSLRSLFDCSNELLLVCPLIIIVFGLLTWRRGKTAKKDDTPSENSRNREKVFLSVSAIFYILAFAVFNKAIGTSRDWDIFAPLALPLVLWISIAIMERFPGRGSEMAILTAAVILTHTTPWIYLNTNAVRSEERFTDLCDHGYWSNRARGYGYSTLAQYNRHQGKTLKAIYLFGQAATHDPGNVRYNYYIGEMYSGLGKHGAALEHYFKVLEQKGDHLEALNDAGASYIELGRPVEAEKYFRRAVEIDPTYLKALQNLGGIYINAGRTVEAVKIFSRAVELSPSDPRLHIGLARACVAAGDIERAERHANEAQRLDPELPADLFEILRNESSKIPRN
jgi:Flp pilus assembly protein TadD